jgi:hypothetical protein
MSACLFFPNQVYGYKSKLHRKFTGIDLFDFQSRGIKNYLQL